MQEETDDNDSDYELTLAAKNRLSTVWSRSGLWPQYCSVMILKKIFVIDIHMYKIIFKKVIFLFCALPNGLRQICQPLF